MSGHTALHEEVESMLCEYTHKKYGYLLNFGYQGQISILDTIVSLRDVIVYDSEAHACLIDGFRVTGAKRFKYQHNDIESLRKQLTQATALAEKQGGGILVATEGVYGMEGDLGALDKIVALKKEFNFRILIDDAHGMGVMGPEGRGTHTHFNCADDIDLYFCAFAKTMAIIGGFIGCNDRCATVFRRAKESLLPPHQRHEPAQSSHDRLRHQQQADAGVCPAECRRSHHRLEIRHPTRRRRRCRPCP